MWTGINIHFQLLYWADNHGCENSLTDVVLLDCGRTDNYLESSLIAAPINKSYLTISCTQK